MADVNMAQYVEAINEAFSGFGDLGGFFSGISVGLGELLAMVILLGIIVGLIAYMIKKFIGR